MEEFLGVLFCGGRGTRISAVTKYVSKSFIPVYDKPVFKFGLEILENSKLVNEITILTNDENDYRLSQFGYKTIIQDDSKVFDMFSGWEYVKEITGTEKNGVLMPGDNICETKADLLIDKFEKTKADFLFSLHEIKNRKKLSEMGSFDLNKKKYYYKNSRTDLKFGVIAPYIIRNNLNYKTVENIFEMENSQIEIHTGYWFDLGDYESIAAANVWYLRNK
jgi:NDP-sugar pyrophosphorylase family protein